MSEKKWNPRDSDRNTYVDLLDAVQEIAALIYFESSLEKQDEWLSDVIVRGIWNIPKEAPDEEIFNNDE
jgi:hypothetical protein